MNAISELKDRLVEYRNSLLEQFIRDIIEDNLDFIADLNTDQLERGVDGTGNNIEPTYRNPVYARLKQRLNSRPGLGIPDLKLTGSFHRKINAKLQGKVVTLDSTDSKTADLLAKYGDVILQLNEESVEVLREELMLPELLIKTERFLLS